MEHQGYQIIQVRREIHLKIRKLAVLNDLKIRDLASKLLEVVLQDEQMVNHVIKTLKVQSS